MQPVLGRGFQEGDDAPGANVVLLGHELWRDRYGSAPDIVGRTIRANTTQMTVIGVMPPKFGFPIREVLWCRCAWIRWRPRAAMGAKGAQLIALVMRVASARLDRAACARRAALAAT